MKHLQTGLCIALSIFLTGCLSSHAAKQKPLPNIVIIYADDMGYGDLACQNPDSKIPTPNLDQLASEGARFTDGHSSSGICTPSRYAMLTGRYHWREFHGIVNSFGPPRFKPERLTLPEMLKTKGYHTACIGKWHLGWDWDAIKNPSAHTRQKTNKKAAFLSEDFDWSKPIGGGPCDNGFDTYFGDGTINFPPYGFVENDRMLVAPTEKLNLRGMVTCEGKWEFRGGPMVKDWDPYQVLPTLATKTTEWINQQQSDQPFFLYLALPSPHAPIIPNIEFQGKTQAGGYGDFMFQTDYIIGQVLDKLQEKGLDDNTIVIFTSDNGPEQYAFERTQKTEHYSMGQLRGLKRDIWEGGHRVPFIVRWPGVIEPGRVSDALVSQIDIMATLASITGYQLDNTAAEDSYDLSTLWRDNTDSTRPRNVHVHNTYKGKYAIRQDHWLLIDFPTGSMTKMPDWFAQANDYDIKKMPNGGLYDMSKSLDQRTNVIEHHPEKAQQLRKLLQTIRDQDHSL